MGERERGTALKIVVQLAGVQDKVRATVRIEVINVDDVKRLIRYILIVKLIVSVESKYVFS